jgi:hypothetical protein
MFKLVTISTATIATVAVLATAAICSFCSCAHNVPNTNVATQITIENLDGVEIDVNIDNDVSAFQKPFGFDLADDSKRAYMMNVEVYDDEGNFEKSYEPIVKDAGPFCGE